MVNFAISNSVRCDRVLWKSTVQPDPESEDDEPLDHSSRPRTRIGHFFANAFRPLSGRARRGSYSSFTSAASVATSSATTEAAVSVADSSPPSPKVTEEVAPFSRFVEPPNRPLSHSRSNELFHVSVKPRALPRPLSTEAAPSLRRSISTSSHNPPTPSSLNRPRRATVSPEILTTALQNHNRVATPSRWRFFPSFLSHGSTYSGSSQDPSLSMDAALPRPPRRGEVLCLNYNTLDDRGMRRLEGEF
jgi:hypothetical protein